MGTVNVFNERRVDLTRQIKPKKNSANLHQPK